MSRPLAKQNPLLRHVLIELEDAARAHEAPIWKAVARRLSRARHQTGPLNVGHLERAAGPSQTVVVAGKLLAAGRLSKPLTVAAFAYSASAREKIRAAGGTALSISELVKHQPKGAGVRLLA